MYYYIRGFLKTYIIVLTVFVNINYYFNGFLEHIVRSQRFFRICIKVLVVFFLNI